MSPLNVDIITIAAAKNTAMKTPIKPDKMYSITIFTFTFINLLNFSF